MNKVSIHQQFYITLRVIKLEINKVGQLQNCPFHCTSKTSKMPNECKILPENSNIVQLLGPKNLTGFMFSLHILWSQIRDEMHPFLLFFFFSNFISGASVLVPCVFRVPG